MPRGRDADAHDGEAIATPKARDAESHDGDAGPAVVEPSSPVVVGLSRNPFFVATDGTNVYWIDVGELQTPSDDAILECPVTGCKASPTVLADNQNLPGGIAARNGYVYWVNSVGGEVMKCAASGCNRTPGALATGQSFPEGVAVNDKSVFWSVQGDGTNVAEGSIMRCPLPDCAGGPRLVASGQHRPYGIVADEHAVAWCNEGIGVLPNPNGSIAICSDLDAGCSSSPMVLYQTAVLNPRRIAMDATSVYFTHYDASLDHADGRVFSCARSGCGGNALVVAEGQAEPYDVAVSSGFVYFTNNSAHDADYSRGAFAEDVVKCPVTGCSNHTSVVATAQGTPRGIAVDQNAVYWANDGLYAVMKAAK
jgi:hypothetical protein